MLAARPALDDSSWSCTSFGAASCPEPEGPGEFSASVDLPAGSGLDVVQLGTAPFDLADEMVLHVEVSADGQAPNFVIDPASDNNQSMDANMSTRISAAGFG